MMPPMVTKQNKARCAIHNETIIPKCAIILTKVIVPRGRVNSDRYRTVLVYVGQNVQLVGVVLAKIILGRDRNPFIKIQSSINEYIQKEIASQNSRQNGYKTQTLILTGPRLLVRLLQN